MITIFFLRVNILFLQMCPWDNVILKIIMNKLKQCIAVSSRRASGWPDLGPKWVRLVPKGKMSDLSHLWPIWPTLGLNLSSLTLTQVQVSTDFVPISNKRWSFAVHSTSPQNICFSNFKIFNEKKSLWSASSG